MSTTGYVPQTKINQIFEKDSYPEKDSTCTESYPYTFPPGSKGNTFFFLRKTNKLSFKRLKSVKYFFVEPATKFYVYIIFYN